MNVPPHRGHAEAVAFSDDLYEAPYSNKAGLSMTLRHVGLGSTGLLPWKEKLF